MKKMFLCMWIMSVIIFCSGENILAEEVPWYPIDFNNNAWGSYVGGESTMYAGRFIPTNPQLAIVEIGILSLALIAEIRTDDNGFPSDTVLSTSELFYNGPDNPVPINGGFLFDPPLNLTPGVVYHVVVYIKPEYINSGFLLGIIGTPATTCNNSSTYDQASNQWIECAIASNGNSFELGLKTFYKDYQERPVAILNSSKLCAGANETLTLDASASNDPDGNILSYSFQRLPIDNEESIVVQPSPIIQWTTLGRAEEVIKLTIMDDKGAIAENRISIINKYLCDMQQNQFGDFDGDGDVDGDDLEIFSENFGQ